MNDATPDERLVFPGGWPQRLYFFMVAVLLPAFCFVLALVIPALAEWQSPDVNTRLQLLILRPGSWAFLPLALGVMAVAAAVATKPGPWLDRWYARVALLLGLVYGVQYAFLLPASAWLDVPMAVLPSAYEKWGLVLLFVFGVYGTYLGLGAAWRFLSRRLPIPLLILAAGVPLIFCWILFALLGPTDSTTVLGKLHESLARFPLYLGIGGLLAGPIFTADAFGRLLWRLGRPARWPVPGLIVGFLAYLGSWRIAIHEASETFAKLPTEPPNCFVATAAARAPLWLAGGFESRAADGRVFRVGPQLQRLKLFEIALRELCPRGHRSLRRVYDRIGPRLAARIDTPARAAVAWLALRPCELAAAGLLRLFAGSSICCRADDFYRRKESRTD